MSHPGKRHGKFQFKQDVTRRRPSSKIIRNTSARTSYDVVRAVNGERERGDKIIITQGQTVCSLPQRETERFETRMTASVHWQ